MANTTVQWVAKYPILSVQTHKQLYLVELFICGIIILMSMLIYFMVAVLGGVFGSFAGAQVWRLRARQLVADEVEGEHIPKSELRRLKPLIDRELIADHSQCLLCGHSLRTLDMIPIISWLVLRGRCRYCHKFIGWSEILLEMGLAVLFVLSVYFWPSPLDGTTEIIKLAIWLVALVLLAILFVYDWRWFLLPDRINFPFIVFGGLFFVLNIVQSDNVVSLVAGTLGAVMILSMLYYILHIVSRGRWIGLGDVKLGLGMALFLMDWRLAFVVLFVSNAIGTLLVLPGILKRTVKSQAKIQFGPLMIAGFLLTWFLGDLIVNWYQALLLI